MLLQQRLHHARASLTGAVPAGVQPNDARETVSRQQPFEGGDVRHLPGAGGDRLHVQSDGHIRVGGNTGKREQERMIRRRGLVRMPAGHVFAGGEHLGAKLGKCNGAGTDNRQGLRAEAGQVFQRDVACGRALQHLVQHFAAGSEGQPVRRLAHQGGQFGCPIGVGAGVPARRQRRRQDGAGDPARIHGSD